jgi:biopolymer transport protein ExbB/TolQ
MRKFITVTTTFTVMVGLISLLWAPALYAQTQSQPPAVGQSAQSSQPQKAVSDQELQAFAKAYVAVEKVQQEHQATLKSVQDSEQKQKLQQEVNAKMAKAIEQQGLTPESYQQILATISTNKNINLTKKAFNLINQERAS